MTAWRPAATIRRARALGPGTLGPNRPRELPGPAKELGVLKLGWYRCGGGAHPDGSCDAHPGRSVIAGLVTNAPQVWAELEQQARARREIGAILGRRR